MPLYMEPPRYEVSETSRHRYWILDLVPIEVLKPHEQVIEGYVVELLKEIAREGKIRKPILVDAKTMVILDGHHRVEVLKRLGKRKIPAILVDYDDDSIIVVTSWRSDWKVTKELVREAGLSGRLLPPKTSRHIVLFDIPEVSVSLELL